MAEDHRGRGLPPQGHPGEESHYAQGEEDRRASGQYHPRPQMGAPVTLPSIQDSSHAYAQSPGGRGWDPRASAYSGSPSSANGYPPPGPGPPQGARFSPTGAGGGYHPPGAHPFLPPVQIPGQEPRPNYPVDQRGQQPVYAQQQRFAPPYPPGPGHEYVYRPDRGPPGPFPPDARAPPPGFAAVMQQSAPRQRTSIACKYCRRRKIRCSGYQNSPGGKCTNCIKMNQECVFQPVSSGTSTAFVPVSALQNGIPPGTQLFGAYGQPISAGPANLSPGGSQGPGGYPAGSPQYDQPLPSPTGSFQSFSDDRSDPGRRRPRPSDEDHGMRLPPPSTFPEEHPKRRSPSSTTTSTSPGHLQSYPPPHPSAKPPGFESSTPPPHGSPANVPTSGAPASSTSSMMSLGNIMDSGPGKDIDSNMLGRLNRRT